MLLGNCCVCAKVGVMRKFEARDYDAMRLKENVMLCCDVVLYCRR